MTTSNNPGPRSRYYDAILKILDNDILPELTSTRAKYSGNLIRKQLARLAAVNDHAPYLPENLASIHADAMPVAAIPSNKSDLHKALLAEGKLLDSIESATDERLKPRAPSAETTAALPESINKQTVEAYLRKHLDPTVTVNNLRVLSGGRSKQTILMSLTDAAGKQFERIIRRDVASSPTGATVPDEYALLKVLADNHYPVPQPYLCEPDASKLGGSPFIVVGKVIGALAGHIFDPPSKAAVLESARVLGQLHALPVAKVAPTLKPERQVAPDAARLRTLVLDLKKAWDDNSRAKSLTVDYVFQWLLENVDSLHPISSVVHGDYSYHNILFEGDKLTAVLDWELVRIGHPAEDLGYMRPAALKRANWDEIMVAYRAGGGPAIERKDQLFYTLLEKLRLLVMLFKVRPYVEGGFSDDIEFIDAIIIAIPRLIQQMSAELREFLDIKG